MTKKKAAKEAPAVKVTIKAVPKKKPKQLFEVKTAYSPGAAGFLWILEVGNHAVVHGAQPYETAELAIAAAHEFLKSV